jgi:hypothetical protein
MSCLRDVDGDRPNGHAERRAPSRPSATDRFTARRFPTVAKDDDTTASSRETAETVRTAAPTHPDNAAVVPHTGSALLLSPVQADVHGLKCPTLLRTRIATCEAFGDRTTSALLSAAVLDGSGQRPPSLAQSGLK